jgi:hypothetical protein
MGFNGSRKRASGEGGAGGAGGLAELVFDDLQASVEKFSDLPAVAG